MRSNPDHKDPLPFCQS